MKSFKEGDIIKGTEKANKKYCVTTSKSTLKVIQDRENGYIRVKVIDHISKPNTTGNRHTVLASHFKLLYSHLQKISNNYNI